MSTTTRRPVPRVAPEKIRFLMESLGLDEVGLALAMSQNGMDRTVSKGQVDDWLTRKYGLGGRAQLVMCRALNNCSAEELYEDTPPSPEGQEV